MIRKLVLGAVLAAALVVPATVRAHAGHAHKVMGTVTVRQENHVEVKTPEGKIVTVVLDDKTKFARGKQKVDATAVKVGDRVVVEVAGEKDMTAKTVTLPAAAPASARK